MTAKFTNFGTILTELHVPGKDGKTADVTDPGALMQQRNPSGRLAA